MTAPAVDTDRLALVIDEILHQHPAAGLAVAVVGPDGLRFFRAVGVSGALLIAGGGFVSGAMAARSAAVGAVAALANLSFSSGELTKIDAILAQPA